MKLQIKGNNSKIFGILPEDFEKVTYQYQNCETDDSFYTKELGFPEKSQEEISFT